MTRTYFFNYSLKVKIMLSPHLTIKSRVLTQEEFDSEKAKILNG